MNMKKENKMSEKTKINFSLLAGMTSEESEDFIDDDRNPHFMFQGFNTDLLLAIASGELDAVSLARTELSHRGVNKDGKWVGFDRSAEIFKAGL